MYKYRVGQNTVHWQTDDSKGLLRNAALHQQLPQLLTQFRVRNLWHQRRTPLTMAETILNRGVLLNPTTVHIRDQLLERKEEDLRLCKRGVEFDDHAQLIAVLTGIQGTALETEETSEARIWKSARTFKISSNSTR
jgi:hypothetical protein